MKGCFIRFKSNEVSSPFFIQGENFDIIKSKLRAHFEANAEKNNDTIVYFNWMTIDSDFSRDYDAELTIHFDDIEGGLERSYSYPFDFDVVYNLL